MIQARARQPWTIRKSSFSFTNVMLFVLPIAATRSINVVGELLISDILVAVSFGVLLWQKRLRLSSPYLKVLLLFLAIWFAGALISDIVNASPLRNLMRGLAKLLLFTLYLIVFFNLIDGRRNKLMIVLTGLAIAAPLSVRPEFIENAGNSALEIAWKFGTGLGLTLLLGLGLMRFGFSRRNSALIFMILGPVHMMMGARSAFLITFLSGFLGLVARPMRSRKKRAKLAVVGLVLLAIGMSGGEVVYDRMVRSGVFGEEVLEKHLNQTAGGTNIILGGRSESLISLVAIHDSPIFGHGSWAESKEYYLLYLQIIQSQGRQANFDAAAKATSFLIPSHSYFLGAWVEHGLAGALFWGTTFVLTARSLVAAVLGRRPAQPFEIFMILNLLWDIMFSPFGSLTRCWAALEIALVSVVLQSDKITDEPDICTHRKSENQSPSHESSKQAS